MHNRERRIEAIAIIKSLIESGMNKPDDEHEITAQQFLKILDRLAGPAEQEKTTPVFTQPQQVSKGGGGMKIAELEERGKYVRVLVNCPVQGSQWASAWEKDAEAIRKGGGQGVEVTGDLVRSKDGKYLNLKNVEVVDEIPF